MSLLSHFRVVRPHGAQSSGNLGQYWGLRAGAAVGVRFGPRLAIVHELVQYDRAGVLSVTGQVDAEQILVEPDGQALVA